MSLSTIQQHIRQAAAHEDAAGRHEDKHAQQMRSAGASMYEAFTLALKGAEEFRGRQLDEKAVARIYASTRPRQWWTDELRAAGLLKPDGKPDRERATRLIQWHVDPMAAQGRRAQHALKEAARRKTLDKQRTSAARGARMPHKSEAVHAARVTQAAAASAAGGRESATPPEPETLGDMLGELNRIGYAVRKVKAGDRGTVTDILKTTAREVERYLA